MVAHFPVDENFTLIRCTVKGESYVLLMDIVQTIERADSLIEQPSPDGSVGWIDSVAGKTRVFALDRQLHRTRGKVNLSGQVVIFHDDAEPWGILVDRVAQLNHVPSSKLHPLPHLPGNHAFDFFQGVVILESGMLLILDPSRIRMPTVAADNSFRPMSNVSAHSPRRNGLGPKVNRFLVFETCKPPANKRPVRIGLSVTQIVEIANEPKWIPYPGTMPQVVGLTSWRDQPIPVLDVSKRLGLNQASNRDTSRLIVARKTSTEYVGLMCEPNLRIHSLPIAHQPSKRKLNVEDGLVHGIIELKEETVVFPDLRYC